ncbi:zinc finger protein 586-like [Pollicipes pollicipes]|uniref:zinc finger protein 586-like n=1 Tax=Pollicipes pollicipes TaxID=41117 RepID=UPI001884BE6A|nr:zinc finger protein 586-like [Pollicipes pollicipes]
MAYEKAHACDICGRTYAHRVSMTLHRKVHEGVTRCTLCGRVCSKVAHLRTHLHRVHKLSGPEVRRLVPTRPRSVPYQDDIMFGGSVCSVCGRRFQHELSLLHHMKIHQGLTVCLLCGRVNNRVADLRKHLRLVHRLSEQEVRDLVPSLRQRTPQRPDGTQPACGDV